MNRTLLVVKSAWFYRRSYAGLIAGTALTAAIVTGALIVGDSVRYTLRQSALLRLGRIEYAASTGPRFFAASVAERLGARLGSDAAPALQLPGMVIVETADGTNSRQINRVQVLGVDRLFWKLAPCTRSSFKADEAAVNKRLAERLGLRAGDTLSVRVTRPGILPDDAPLANRREESTVRGRFTVLEVAGDDELGRFRLENDQSVPLNIFVPLSWLQERIGQTAKANLLLVASNPTHALTDTEVELALKQVWQPEDAGFHITPHGSNGLLQVTCDRVFFDEASATAVNGLPFEKAGTFTYLVNSLSTTRSNAVRSIPYSFVTAIAPSADPLLGPLPRSMANDEILLNRWTANELGVVPGDRITMKSFILQSSGALAETSREFRVSGIPGIETLGMEKELVPDFPGLSDVESCKDWDIGIPLDETMLKDPRNEDYWKQYRQTPKALVTLNAGQAMWANRFGNLTAVRFDAARSPASEIHAALKSALTPRIAGLSLMPIRAQARNAVRNATDFGGLFLGMSFFLVIAALLLTALLHAFSLQQRAPHIGRLRAVGFRTRTILVFLVTEGALAGLLGVLVGIPLALLYAKVLVRVLSMHWQSAVAGTPILFHAAPVSLVCGAVVAIGFTLVAATASSTRLLRSTPLELLNWDFTQEQSTPARASRRRLTTTLALATAFGVIALMLTLLTPHHSERAADVFFGAGFCLLVSGIAALSAFLQRAAPADLSTANGSLSLLTAAVRNLARRRRRNLVAAATLAGGCFVLFSVVTMQTDVTRNAAHPSSATGGYDYYAESSVPVLPDSRTGGSAARSRNGRAAFTDLDVIAIKLHEGDHAGCLNLNQAQSPRLLGIEPEEFARRGLFTEPGTAALWSLLTAPSRDGTIPALAADTDTLQWGLKKRASPADGDILEMNDEQGHPVRLRLVGALPHRQSVFHGSVLLSVSNFNTLFPSEAGHREFLINPAAKDAHTTLQSLQARFSQLGMDVTRATDRLLEFHAVEQSYLAMFLALGGFGLLLGSAGMGVVVLRNLAERRRELAIMRAIGFRRSRVRRLLMLEHAMILTAGLCVGSLAAGIAMIPSIVSSSTLVPWKEILLTFAATALTALLWIALCVCLATRREAVASALNEE